MLAKYQVGFRDADVLRAHDLVGAGFLEHPILVDTGLVGEGIASHDRLVSLHPHPGDRTQQPAGGNQSLGLDAGVAMVIVTPGTHCHDHFFQAAVAGPFADPQGGGVDAVGAGPDGGEAVRDAQAAFESLQRQAAITRTWGDCYGYLLLASGMADVMIDPYVNSWDFHCMLPIIHGAGGIITDHQGNDPLGRDSVVASHPDLHGEIIQGLSQ